MSIWLRMDERLCHQIQIEPLDAFRTKPVEILDVVVDAV